MALHVTLNLEGRLNLPSCWIIHKLLSYRLDIKISFEVTHVKHFIHEKLIMTKLIRYMNKEAVMLLHFNKLYKKVQEERDGIQRNDPYKEYYNMKLNFETTTTTWLFFVLNFFKTRISISS